MKLSKSSTPIDVDSSINSGQVFLWQKIDECWYGINGQDVIRISQRPLQIKHMCKKYDFFRTSDDYDKIIQEISKDRIIKNAVKRFYGLRLLRQDPFQCFISFIVSSNSNIAKIKRSLGKLCQMFGEKCEFDKKEFFLFPKPEKLAGAQTSDLLRCGLGYRAKFVKKAAQQIANKQIDLNELIKKDYVQSKEQLLKVSGVGSKVADCIMLFSLEKLDAFPLDTWMQKILRKYYFEKFQFEKITSEKKYSMTHDKIVGYFGANCGYAQQFLFKMEREDNKKGWL